ncbi:MAG: hypothetical protein HYU63_03280 [Armatimonadetes bacterium]|nr:hypothetical protein [Armatimonadota bacterium]
MLSIRIIKKLLSEAGGLEKKLPHTVNPRVIESKIEKLEFPVDKYPKIENLKPKPVLSRKEQLLLSKGMLEKIALKLKEEIALLLKNISTLRDKLSKRQSEILRNDLMIKIRNLNSEIEKKTIKLREIEIKIDLIGLELRVK